jgi:hypothetical protein
MTQLCEKYRTLSIPPFGVSNFPPQTWQVHGIISFDAVIFVILFYAERPCSGARGTKARTEKEKRLIPRRLEQCVMAVFIAFVFYFLLWLSVSLHL